MLLVQNVYKELRKTSNKQNKKYSRGKLSGMLGEIKQIFANVKSGEKLVVIQDSRASEGNKFGQHFNVQSAQKERKGKNPMQKDSEQRDPIVEFLKFTKV